MEQKQLKNLVFNSQNYLYLCAVVRNKGPIAQVVRAADS